MLLSNSAQIVQNHWFSFIFYLELGFEKTATIDNLQNLVHCSERVMSNVFYSPIKGIFVFIYMYF